MIVGTENKLVDVMLELVQTAVLERGPVALPSVDINWDKMMDMALEHGLLGWVSDGMDRVSNNNQIPRQQRINWGLSAQKQVEQYYRQKDALDRMILTCNNNNIKLLLLKGIGLSEYYPKPSSRLSSDIDIYLFGEYEKGNELLLDRDAKLAEKHYVGVFNGIQIENHIWLIDMGTPLQQKVEKYLELSLDDCVKTEAGYYVLPTKPLILYLLMHLLAHLNNPQDDPIKIRSIIDFCMVLRSIEKGELYELGKLIAQFDLSRSYMLFVELSEWVLSVDMSEYKLFQFESKDVPAAVRLLVDDNLRHPDYSGTPKYKQLINRWSRYRQIRWRYKYLPTMEKKRIYLFINDFLHDAVKSILGLSPNDSLRSLFKSSVAQR